jgi:hypothetical protein
LNGLEWVRGGDFPNITTKEGDKPIIELLEWIPKLKEAGVAIPPFTWKDQLQAAAKEYVEELDKKGEIVYTNTAESVAKRLLKQGKLIGNYGENVVFFAEEAIDIVLEVIIDDGYPGRGHRKNIFSPKFKEFGCYTGEHSASNMMTCMEFITCILKEDEPNPFKEKVDEFMKEEVAIETPPGAIGHKIEKKFHVEGLRATKIIVKTYKMDDGSIVTYNIAVSKEFNL